jgi:hypothetical protein
LHKRKEAAMNRRFLFPLAAGVVGLLAISPALVNQPAASAAGSKPSKPSKPAKPAKGTTTSTSPDGASNPDDGSGSGNDPGANPGSDSGSSPDAGSGPDSGTAPDSGSGPDSGSSSSSAPNGKSGPSSTTAPAPGGHTSSTTCNAPETNQGPAPQMGEPAQSHDADPAGTVDVERLSETELRVAKATPNDGWVEQVATASGPRITVKFTRQGQSPSLIRFAASMDQKGTMIHIRVTSCG